MRVPVVEDFGHLFEHGGHRCLTRYGQGQEYSEVLDNDAFVFPNVHACHVVAERGFKNEAVSKPGIQTE